METRSNKPVEIRFVYDEEIEKIIEPLSRKTAGEGDCIRRLRERSGACLSPRTPSRRTSTRHILKDQPTESEDELDVTLTAEINIEHPEAVIKPKEALLGDADFQGQQIFGFQTPKRKNALVQKALEYSQTPETESTPRSRIINGGTTPTSSRRRIVTPHSASARTPRRKCGTPVTKVQTPSTPSHNVVPVEPKTPYNLRRKISNKLSRMADTQSSDSDISPDESDYCPSDEQNDENDSDDDDDDASKASNEDNSSDTDGVKIQRVLPRKAGIVSSGTVKENDYKLEPEQYFGSQTGGRQLTSGRVLGCRLSQEALQRLLLEIPETHSHAITGLYHKYIRLFPRLHLVLREGFSVLLYGVGSKRMLLQSFQETVMDDNDVLVINGFFPSLLINEIVTTIAKDVLELSNVPADLYECLEIVEKQYSGAYRTRLYLIIHNIDGEMLRSDKCQDVLSRLASAPNIHLLASIDHVNAPLVWDQAKLSRFNFTWWDVTNFQPYTCETSFESSVMVKNSGTLALSSLNNVFKALTSNARSIFLLIAQRHIENKENNSFRGILFRDLYQACRDALLVSSDLALRSQLSDFLDHQLLKSRRGADGAEYLLIPVEPTVLSQFMNLHNEE